MIFKVIIVKLKSLLHIKICDLIGVWKYFSILFNRLFVSFIKLVLFTLSQFCDIKLLMRKKIKIKYLVLYSKPKTTFNMVYVVLTSLVLNKKEE